jgi:hypothetical protein
VTAAEKKRDLALYRLQEAEESLDEAERLSALLKTLYVMLDKAG